MHQLIYNPCWILKYSWEQAEALSSEHRESMLQMIACVCVSSSVRGGMGAHFKLLGKY